MAWAKVFLKSNRVEVNSRPYSWPLCSKGGIYLWSGIQDAPDKENGTRLNVANQEDEGAV